MPTKLLKPAISRLRGFTPSQAYKFRQAALLCVEAMNTWDFEFRVKNFIFEGNKTFKMSNSKSNAEIYDHIMSGNDLFSWSNDGDVDIDATLYFANDDTVGYTFATSIRTWINKRFFFRWPIPKISGNIAHEYMHLLGYNHSVDLNDTIRYTVPYGVGYIVADIAAEIYQPSRHSAKVNREKVTTGIWPFRKTKYVIVDS